MTALVVTILGVFALAFLLSLALSRFVFRDSNWHFRSGHASVVYGFIGTIYAIVVGFLMVFQFQTFQNAKDQIAVEASAVRNLDLLSVAYSDAVRADIQHALVCYADSVVLQDWPAMAKGNADPRTDQAVEVLYSTYGSIDQEIGKPGLQNQNLVSSSRISYKVLADRGEARSARLLVADQDLPILVWLFVLSGAGMLIGLTYFFLVGIVAGTMAMLLPILIFLDSPFDEDLPGDLKPKEIAQAADYVRSRSVDQASIDKPCLPVTADSKSGEVVDQSRS
jgi:hypothetical protein